MGRPIRKDNLNIFECHPLFFEKQIKNCWHCCKCWFTLVVSMVLVMSVSGHDKKKFKG